MANDPSWMLTNPAEMFHLALDNAGIPVDGVGLPHPEEEFHPDWHIVTRDDGMVVHITYRPEATPDQIVEGDDIAMTLDLSPRRVRSAWDIFADISALSNNQKTAISNDLKASSNAKIKSLSPPHDGVMMALDWAATTGTVIQTRDAYCRIAALYVQQNIHYLEQPAFDPTINIPGWEVIPAAQLAKYQRPGVETPGPWLPDLVPGLASTE